MLRSISLAAVALVQGVPAGPGERVERTGEHFLVSCRFPAGSGADQALSAAEATWPIAVELLGAGEFALARPLTIVVYPDVRQYEAAEQRMTKGRFKQNLSFSHWDTKTAHIALQPPCSQEVLQEIGLPWQTLRSVAHEAAHLACYEMLPNYRVHPTWFAEGYACRIEELAMKALGWSASCEEEPYFSSLIARCQQLASKSELPSFDDLLAERTKLSTSDNYAVRSLFFEYLHSRRPAEIGHVVERLRALSSPTAAVVRSSLRKLWPPESGVIDLEFAAFLGEKKPRWDEVCRSLETVPDGFLQSAFADTNAIAWNSGVMSELPFVAAGSLRVLPGSNTQLNFLLGRQEEGFYSVAFAARSGGVTVFRYRSASNDWTTLARTQDKALSVGREIDFRIRCTESAITVALEGDELLRAPIDTSPLGAWGLGAQSGSTGVWKRIEVGAEK